MNDDYTTIDDVKGSGYSWYDSIRTTDVGITDVHIQFTDGTTSNRTLKEIQDALELYDQYQEYKDNIARIAGSSK